MKPAPRDYDPMKERHIKTRKGNQGGKAVSYIKKGRKEREKEKEEGTF